MTDKTENELELKENKANSNGHPPPRKATKLKVVIEKVKLFFKFFTVEPYLICYIFPNIISSLSVQKLNMLKACRVDLGIGEGICDDALEGRNDDNATQAALDDLQRLVADMTAWQQPLQSGFPALIILFVGAWSDNTGNRKALMLIPIIGELISSTGLLLATYFFLEWPLWVTAVIEALPTALSGGLSVALMGAYSYVADVTTPESRTFRIGLVAVIVTLGIPLGSSVSGVLTEAVGFYGIFSISVALYSLGIIHTYFRIKDVKKVALEGSCMGKIVEFFNPKNAWSTLSLAMLSRGKKLVLIWLVIIIHVVVMGPIFGEAPLLQLYVLKKFNMTLVDISFFYTYSILIGLAGTTIAITLFSKRWKMHDTLIGIITTSSKILGTFLYGLAPNKTWFLFGPVAEFFGSAGATIVRSLGTKVVETDEVGKMCSLIGFVEALVPVIYTPIYSTVYSKTLDTLPGAFYLLGGSMTIPALFIYISLYIMHKREERDVVKNPEAKEVHAHDNDVTVL